MDLRDPTTQLLPLPVTAGPWYPIPCPPYCIRLSLCRSICPKLYISRWKKEGGEMFLISSFFLFQGLGGR